MLVIKSYFLKYKKIHKSALNSVFLPKSYKGKNKITVFLEYEYCTRHLIPSALTPHERDESWEGGWL